ncbi:MAG TPA: alpha/beta hydrolase domain-containing protein [Hyphomonadaceae bacterium]|jgi:hypothetical protein|nr:alpha/beta hydrolase domain-containing protein [Hyphomonadaceae bacterium]
MIRTRLAAATILATAIAAPAFAHVTGVEIKSRAPIDGEFGKAGKYEMITGVFHGEVDPKDTHNTIITDLAQAPVNARGLVEYSATFALSKPVDMSLASGVLFYDTSNRGNGRAQGDAEGHIHVISGWQGDIPAGALQYATLPIAKGVDGGMIATPILVRFVNMDAGAKSIAITAGLGAGVPRPEPLSMQPSGAKLVRKKTDKDKGQLISNNTWAFADCRTVPFPGTPDPHQLCVKDGFDPAYAYELTYMAKNPVVLGLGFAATRDLVTFLRYDAGTEAAQNPVAGKLKYAIGTGVSQAGNFIRSFVHLGFNAGEDSRIVFDGINPHIAARQVPLNIRFSVPGGAANLYEPGSEGALWWGKYKDPRTGKITSLLDRCTASATCPKVAETFGSAEFWGLRASQMMIGLDAKADIPLPPNVRRYYFPSVTHGGGGGGFDTVKLPNPPAGCSLPGNPNPSSDQMRAVTKSLVDWVTTGKEPLASRYPRLTAGDLVEPYAAAMGFPSIPNQPQPDGKLNRFPLQFFGSAFIANDVSGVMSVVPPGIKEESPSLVPRVNADGNETSGIPSVQARVPLGTYLGWNTFAGGYYKGQGCGFQGGYIPFARTKAEREAAKDPRLSLEERYGTHEGFVAKVKTAAAELEKEGFLLPDDAQRIVKQAEESNVLK